MTRSSILIGVCAFVLATMGTVSIDPSNRDITLRDISLGGSPALAQPELSLEDLAGSILELELGGDDADDDAVDDDAADDDDVAAKDDADDE